MQCVFQMAASSLRSDAAIDLLMHLVSQVDPFCIQWVFTDVWYLFFLQNNEYGFLNILSAFSGGKKYYCMSKPWAGKDPNAILSF